MIKIFEKLDSLKSNSFIEKLINEKSEKIDTPLIIATKKNNLEIIKTILSRNETDVNITDFIKGNTALHISIVEKFSEITNLLLNNKKVSQNILNNDGLTQLQLLSKYQNHERIEEEKKEFKKVQEIPQVNENNDKKIENKQIKELTQDQKDLEKNFLLKKEYDFVNVNFFFFFYFFKFIKTFIGL
jgi:ankyrin repeat protein